MLHAADSDYAGRLAAEQRFYKDCKAVHELPDIFHYWSNKFVRPKLERLGFTHPEAFFGTYLDKAYVASRQPHRLFLSIGAGNCDTEAHLARDLLARGHQDFTIECIDLNQEMLNRGRALAESTGVSRHLITTVADVNTWHPTREYDGIIANQALHHVVNLEGLFQGFRECIAPTGYFVTSDIIGRNGHMRWPEALAIIREYWLELPREYTYNCLLARYEQTYENWDCSAEGFEGIRAQDILPLLIEYFDFDFFFAFANVIDPFVDRAFGHNFDPQKQWDRDFIDRVNARDEAEIAAGVIKPTHMIAALYVRAGGESRVVKGMTPQACVREPGSPRTAFAAALMTPPVHRSNWTLSRA
jgi:2-polyprenyl-3-methyl-5-hydroxy-6-metoxy-1,4-benzoquinol methylase